TATGRLTPPNHRRPPNLTNCRADLPRHWSTGRSAATRPPRWPPRSWSRCWATSSASAVPQHTRSASGRPHALPVASQRLHATPPEPKRRRCPTAERHHTPHHPIREKAMTNTTGYTRLPKTTREDVLAAAHKQAERAA